MTLDSTGTGKGIRVHDSEMEVGGADEELAYKRNNLNKEQDQVSLKNSISFKN